MFLGVQVLMGVGSPVGLLFKFRNLKTEGLPMEKDEATAKADNLINLMIQFQPHAIRDGALSNPDLAKQVAQSLAALRAELITQLTPQQ